MALLINATKEDITVKVAGNYFSVKAGKEKRIHNEDIARFIKVQLPDCGLAVMHDVNEDLEGEDREAAIAEQNAIKEGLIKEALTRYIDKHRAVIYNNQVSLKKDLASANMQIDPAVLASDGELHSMRIVAAYQRQEADATQAKVDEVKKLTQGYAKGR